MVLPQRSSSFARYCSSNRVNLAVFIYFLSSGIGYLICSSLYINQLYGIEHIPTPECVRHLLHHDDDRNGTRIGPTLDCVDILTWITVAWFGVSYGLICLLTACISRYYLPYPNPTRPNQATGPVCSCIGYILGTILWVTNAVMPFYILYNLMDANGLRAKNFNLYIPALILFVMSICSLTTVVVSFFIIISVIGHKQEDHREQEEEQQVGYSRPLAIFYLQSRNGTILV